MSIDAALNVHYLGDDAAVAARPVPAIINAISRVKKRLLSALSIDTASSENEDNVPSIDIEKKRRKRHFFYRSINGALSSIGTTIYVSREVADKFRSYVIARYGQLQYRLKEEVEKALLYWIQANSISSTKNDVALDNLDFRIRRGLNAIKRYCMMHGILERPVYAWRRIVEEALELEFRRRPDRRTVARYMRLLPRAGIVEERANGTIWRLKL